MGVVVAIRAVYVLFVAGGCSAFGHSCFGGHGKRTDGNAILLPGPDSDQQPLLVFRPEEEDADDAMVQQGALPSAWSATAGISPRQPPPLPAKYNLTPFLRQWVRTSFSRGESDAARWIRVAQDRDKQL